MFSGQVPGHGLADQRLDNDPVIGSDIGGGPDAGAAGATAAGAGLAGTIGGRRPAGARSAASSSSSASKLCALTTASQYGQAAAMPPTSGLYLELCVRGFAHTIR